MDTSAHPSAPAPSELGPSSMDVDMPSVADSPGSPGLQHLQEAQAAGTRDDPIVLSSDSSDDSDDDVAPFARMVVHSPSARQRQLEQIRGALSQVRTGDGPRLPRGMPTRGISSFNTLSWDEGEDRAGFAAGPSRARFEPPAEPAPAPPPPLVLPAILMTPPSRCLLLNLPDEILTMIASYFTPDFSDVPWEYAYPPPVPAPPRRYFDGELHHVKLRAEEPWKTGNLAAMAGSCARLRRLCEPVLWRYVTRKAHILDRPPVASPHTRTLWVHDEGLTWVSQRALQRWQYPALRPLYPSSHIAIIGWRRRVLNARGPAIGPLVVGHLRIFLDPNQEPLSWTSLPRDPTPPFHDVDRWDGPLAIAHLPAGDHPAPLFTPEQIRWFRWEIECPPQEVVAIPGPSWVAAITASALTVTVKWKSSDERPIAEVIKDLTEGLKHVLLPRNKMSCRTLRFEVELTATKWIDDRATSRSDWAELERVLDEICGTSTADYPGVTLELGHKERSLLHPLLHIYVTRHPPERPAPNFGNDDAMSDWSDDDMAGLRRAESEVSVGGGVVVAREIEPGEGAVPPPQGVREP